MMKTLTKSFLALFLTATAISGFVACKPTEANYRAAYEKAIAGKDDSNTLDSTIYGRYRRDFSPLKLAVGTDTMPMKGVVVRFSEDAGVGQREWLRKYCIVAGEFKQLFNAKSMARRMSESGYARAFVAETREPFYYVVAYSTDTPAVALREIHTIEADTTIRLRQPCPWLLLRR